MQERVQATVTQLLIRWRGGEEECLNDLLPLVERELHRIAHRFMNRERRNHTLQPTALVHEAYLRLIDRSQVKWQNRAHFIAIAAQLMRQVLVDHSRGVQRQKLGGGSYKVPLDEALIFSPSNSVTLLALDEALTRLGERDPRMLQVVELRYFGGLDVEETAEVLHVHPNTVINDWAVAKAWLKKELRGMS